MIKLSSFIPVFYVMNDEFIIIYRCFPNQDMGRWWVVIPQIQQLDAQVMPNAVVFSAVLHCYARSPKHIFCELAESARNLGCCGLKPVYSLNWIHWDRKKRGKKRHRTTLGQKNKQLVASLVYALWLEALLIVGSPYPRSTGRTGWCGWRRCHALQVWCSDDGRSGLKSLGVPNLYQFMTICS